MSFCRGGSPLFSCSANVEHSKGCILKGQYLITSYCFIKDIPKWIGIFLGGITLGTLKINYLFMNSLLVVQSLFFIYVFLNAIDHSPCEWLLWRSFKKVYIRRRSAGGGRQNGNRKGRKELTEGQKGEEKGEKGREAKAGMERTREESSDADVIKSYSHTCKPISKFRNLSSHMKSSGCFSHGEKMAQYIFHNFSFPFIPWKTCLGVELLFLRAFPAPMLICPLLSQCADPEPTL